MHALFSVPAPDRAAARLSIAQQAGREWLRRQGAAHGFALPGEVAVDGYATIRIPRAKARPAQFGVECNGVLEVPDP